LEFECKKKISYPNSISPFQNFYTPALTLSKGSSELRTFLNIYTQTGYYDISAQKVNQSIRSNYLNFYAGYLYGLNRRINIGAEMLFKSVRTDSLPASFTNVFQLHNNSTARSALSHIGPVIRWSPFRNIPSITYQSTFYFSLIKTPHAPDGSHPFLDYPGSIWWNQFMYNTQLNKHWYYYGGIDLTFRFWKEASINPFLISASLKSFISYFPGRFTTFYAMAEWSPSIGIQNGYWLQTGIGVKIFLSKHIEIESAMTKFLQGKNAGAGSTINFGSRSQW